MKKEIEVEILFNIIKLLLATEAIMVIAGTVVLVSLAPGINVYQTVMGIK